MEMEIPAHCTLIVIVFSTLIFNGKLRKKLQGEGTPDTSLVELTRSADHWTEKDGYFYYNAALKPGEVTAPIFTAVTFKADMGNEYQNATATVDVFAQAVQTANNGATVMAAQGWPKA